MAHVLKNMWSKDTLHEGCFYQVPEGTMRLYRPWPGSPHPAHGPGPHVSTPRAVSSCPSNAAARLPTALPWWSWALTSQAYLWSYVTAWLWLDVPRAGAVPCLALPPQESILLLAPAHREQPALGAPWQFLFSSPSLINFSLSNYYSRLAKLYFFFTGDFLIAETLVMKPLWNKWLWW